MVDEVIHNYLILSKASVSFGVGVGVGGHFEPPPIKRTRLLGEHQSRVKPGQSPHILQQYYRGKV